MGNVNCLLSASLVLAGISCFAGDLSVEGNLNVTSNLSSRSLSATGAAVGSLAVDGATVLNGTLTVAGQRVQAGANASATNGNTFVWSDGTVFGSTASNQFSAFASGGFRFLGGQIQGDGAGLSNLTVTVALATNSVTADKLAGGSVTTVKLADDSVTSAKIADGSLVDADIAAGAGISQSKVSGLPAAVGLLNAHTASAANPHQVTAAQVGAYTTNQTDAAITSALSGFNPGSCVQTNHTGDVTVGGTLAALMFMGNGAGLTNLTAAGVTPGAIGTAALALGAVVGTSIANGAVGQSQLVDDSVTSAKIADGSIVDADVSAGAAISQAKVEGLPTALGLLNAHTVSIANPHQVTAVQVGAYTTNQTDSAIAFAFASAGSGSCVQTNHTGDVTVGGILAALMFNGNGAGLTNLTAASMAPGSVGAEALAPGAVVGASIANGAVGQSQLADGSVGGTKLADGAVTAAKLASGSVGTNEAVVVEWNSWGDARYMGQGGNQQGVLLADGSVPVAGNLQLAGTNRVTGLADAIDDTDAVNRRTVSNIVQNAILQALLNVERQGDVSMGSFTTR